MSLLLAEEAPYLASLNRVRDGRNCTMSEHVFDAYCCHPLAFTQALQRKPMPRMERIFNRIVDFLDAILDARDGLVDILAAEAPAGRTAAGIGLVFAVWTCGILTGPWPFAEAVFPWILWAVLLVTQNAAFTLVSRARTSGSLLYHAIAAVFSNGVWFASQFILVDKFLSLLKGGTWTEIVGTGLFYCTFTIIGSVGMHVIALKTEKGKAARRS